MASAARLLLVEDDAGLALLLSEELTASGHLCEVAHSGQQALELFRNPQRYDLALLDYALPDMQANQLVATALVQGHMPPFIVLTGRGDERIAVELMKLGARDYLLKDTALLARLPGVVARVLEELAVKRQLAQAELALKQSEAELAAIHEHAPVMMVLLDHEHRVRRLNRAALEFSGLAPADVPGLRLSDWFGCTSTDSPNCPHSESPLCGDCPVDRAVRDTLATGSSHHRLEVQPKLSPKRRLPDLTLLLSSARVAIEGHPMVLLCLEDITSQKQLEQQLRQAQKMEAIGQLAGGVAHDFNNILTGTLMQLGLLQGDPSVPAALRKPLKTLEEQAERAASLTRQLLLFSRRQMMQVKPVDLNELLDNMLKMLRRLLGEHVTIEFRSQRQLPRIQADPGMIEQVVMNLCVNARDAMPDGGRLTLTTEPVELTSQQPLDCPDARPGRFVRFTVADTGCGMDETVLPHIFEPFFTTKDVGKGTGLGLATVFGIVKQHEGWIQVRSVVGQGSLFSVFLPAGPEPSVESSTPAETEPIRGGTETILLVEDELSVRKLIAEVLQRHGYTVLEAATGAEALRLWQQHRPTIDLLFSDMVMPDGPNGLRLAERLRADNPRLRVILSSGYSAELLAPPSIQDIVFIPKPCRHQLLARTVRQCLDS